MWLESPSSFILRSATAHIWQTDLNIDISTQIEFWQILSQDERERASRFRFQKDKIHYIAARGILRKLLGKYLKKEANAIAFGYSNYGKPFVLKEKTLQFNISHSAEKALFGFINHYPIGVDIEFLKRDIEVEKLAKRFFSVKESQRLLALPKTQYAEGFFNCWTRKEAIIKAIGQGLSFPLDQFEVTLQPTKAAKLLATYWNTKEVKEWNMESFIPTKNYVGALAVRGKLKHIKYFKW